MKTWTTQEHCAKFNFPAFVRHNFCPPSQGGNVFFYNAAGSSHNPFNQRINQSAIQSFGYTINVKDRSVIAYIFICSCRHHVQDVSRYQRREFDWSVCQICDNLNVHKWWCSSVKLLNHLIFIIRQMGYASSPVFRLALICETCIIVFLFGM